MNEAEAKSKGNVYAPQLTSNRTGRNKPCPCGSGRKYKKCCLIKEQERNRIMQEVKDKLGKDVPSQEEAVRLLRGYTNQRIIQHNATVQVLHNITQCLEALPPSEKRDFVKADFERRLNELVGDGKGRDAQVTQALAELMAQFPVPEVNLDEKVKVFKLTLHTGEVFYATKREEIEILKQNLINDGLPEEEHKHYESDDWIEEVEMTHRELQALPTDDRAAELFSERPQQEIPASEAVSDELENDVQAEQTEDEVIENEIDEIVEDEAATISEER